MSNNAMKQHGAFSWNELDTNDVEAAKIFYSELLGWQFQEVQTCDMNYNMIKSNNQDVGGIMATPTKNKTPAWQAYVTVDDVDARVARVEQLGGKVCIAPQDIPDVGRFAMINDPQGAMLALISYCKQD